MKCTDAELALLGSLDQALPAPEQAELDTHLATCAACRDFAAVQQALDQSLKSALGDKNVHSGFTANVLARVDALESSGRALSREVLLRTAAAEHEAFVNNLRSRAVRALRRGLLDGVAAAAVLVGALQATRQAWPKLEHALALQQHGVNVPPAVLLGCILAALLGIAAALVVRSRITPAALWSA